MKVRECMCSKVFCVRPEASISEVAKIMSDKHVGCIPVCNNDKHIVGLVTDRDLILRAIANGKDSNKTPVSEVMTTKVYNVSSDAEVSEASKIMCDCQIKRVPVIENDTLVGIITLGDLANNDNVNTKEMSNTVEGICKCDNNAKNAN